MCRRMHPFTIHLVSESTLARVTVWRQGHSGGLLWVAWALGGDLATVMHRGISVLARQRLWPLLQVTLLSPKADVR